jgi:hypothetical protein
VLNLGKTPNGSATLARNTPDQIARFAMLFQSQERNGCAIGSLPLTTL